MTKTPELYQHANEAERLGGEIRELRKARNLTLKQLSKLISCSAAYLSRIELGTARISAEFLKNISEALQVQAQWFFPNVSGEGPLEQKHIVRKKNRRPLNDLYSGNVKVTGIEDELLSSSLSGQFYLRMSRFPPVQGTQPEQTDNENLEGEQHGLVVRGEIELILGNETIVLNAGDSFSYPSMITHQFRNRKNEEAIILRASAPVRIN